MGKQNPQYIGDEKQFGNDRDNIEIETQKPEEPWPLSHMLPRWESDFRKRTSYLATHTIARVQKQY